MVSSKFLTNTIYFIRKNGSLYLALLLVLGLPFLWFFPSRGLHAKYYDNREWRGEPVLSKRERRITLETVSQRQDSFPQRNFCVTWDGWIRIDREGEYIFATESDDGSSLLIDNKMIVDNGGFHSATKVSEKIFLTKGLHSFKINYFQAGGSYDLWVYWTVPGKTETGISPYVLYPHPFPIRGLGFLTRHLDILYPLSWLFLFLVLGRRILRKQNKTGQLLKQYAQNISLSLITLFIFMIFAEGVIRLALYIREDRRDVQLLLQESRNTEFQSSRTYSLKGIVQDSPHKEIVYELKPNLNGIFRKVPLVTNSRGLRDFEYSYRKPKNTFRIVGLGDSSLFGWGVEMEDISLKYLEKKLNRNSASMKYEVINFAVPGYNTAIEVEVFMKKCLRYSPDLVIMHFNTNDYDAPGFMKPPQSYSTLRKSYLFDFIYSRYQLLQGAQQKEVLPFVFDRTLSVEQSERLDEDPAFPDEYRHLVGLKAYLRAMDKLIQETKVRGIPLLVYVVKAYPGLNPSYTPNRFRTEQLELITRLSQEKGFYLLNMYPYYMDYLKENPGAPERVFWVTRADAHPSAAAHKIEGKALYRFLVDNKLVNIKD